MLRGLHYQIQRPQGTLVRAAVGEVYVVVDIRRGSRTLGKHVATRLSVQNKRVIWAPPGFAHGFLVTSDYADFLYKTTDYWAPGHERCILWNDPDLNIPWPLDGEPVLSARDRVAQPLHSAEVFP